jgi:UDP-N-acetylmuramoylalanine--D-glutamate ligase
MYEVTSGKNVTVMGLGRFGGGLGVTRWLLQQGANVLLTDCASADSLAEPLQDLGTHENLTIVLGEHREQDFANADLVIANPAVATPWNNPFLQVAWNAGVEVTTEIELLVQRLHHQRIIGITGTSGKSTTASMIYAGLVSAGVQSHLGGNIGGSLLSNLDFIATDDVVVLELSSAMLWWLEKNGGWSPNVAVITTIEPNHIDWHGSFEEYKKCKEYLFAHQSENDIALTQDECASFDGLKVLGKHNERNAAVAFLACIAVGADASKTRLGITNFHGLPHRLQCVEEGVYNDSKSTTPLATKFAVDAFDKPETIHLLVGGYDKQVDLSILSNQSERVACLYAFGATAQTIVSQAKGESRQFSTLEQAVAGATQSMQKGNVLLLSPGCASWDQFTNYEERGDLFCKLVTASNY